MNLEELKKLADSFFEWPAEDRTHVTTTSAILFAQHALAAAPRPEAVQSDDVADHAAMREAKHRMITSQGWDRGQGTAFADGWTQCAYHYGIRNSQKLESIHD